MKSFLIAFLCTVLAISCKSIRNEIPEIDSDPGHQEALLRLRAAMDTWIAETGDQGQWLEPEELVLPFVREMHDWFGTPDWYTE